MNLAERIEALRRQHQRGRGARAATPGGRPALHAGGRFARWHVAEAIEQESDSWLLTYLDLITLLLAMLVVLLAVSQMPRPSATASAPVELVGSVGHVDSLPPAWSSLAVAWQAYAQQASDTSEMSDTATVATPSAVFASAAHRVSDTSTVPVSSAVFASAAQQASDTHPVPGTPTVAAASAVLASAAQQAPDAPEPQPPSITELGLDDLGDGVDVIVNEKSISFRISNELLFPSGQAVLSPSGLRLIQRMATVINRSQGYPVSVEGHSDPVPIQTRQFPSNWELSASRATSVLRELVRDGVDPVRLRAVGYADTHPIAANDTPAGRAANRRVELIMEITPRRDAAGAGPAATASAASAPADPPRPAAD